MKVSRQDFNFRFRLGASLDAMTHQFPQNILLLPFLRAEFGLGVLALLRQGAAFMYVCIGGASAAALVAQTDPRVFFLENAKTKILRSLTKVRD